MTLRAFTDHRAAQFRKVSALVRAMTTEEARAFLVKGHVYRRAWMDEHIGAWGQTLEDIVKRKVGIKLGILPKSCK